MHLCIRIALLVAIASVAKTSVHAEEITHDVDTHREAKDLVLDHEAHLGGEEITQEYEYDREGRRRRIRRKDKKEGRLNFGIISSLIDFENSNCTTGTCMSQKECQRANGTEGDRCANGFGVCCVVEDDSGDGDYEGGDTTITGDGGDFLNPDATLGSTRQEIVETVTYAATVEPADDKVQIEVHIRSMDIAGPVEGDCGNSSLTITGTNPGPEVPVLCGVATDQKLYLDIDNPSGPIVFTMMITLNGSMAQTWNISIRLLSTRIAPPRCLQYYEATSGSIATFNVMGDPPMMINDQMYTICFGYVSGFCNIAFNVEIFDIPCGYGYALVGDDQVCGSDLSDTSVTANATGPINIGIRSFGMNDLGAEGAKATYTMLGC